MKLVIKISSSALRNEFVLPDFVKAVAQLLSEGHRVTIVHGSGCHGSQISWNSGSSCDENEALMRLGTQMNKDLVARIGRAGIAAIGLCGADGNIVKVRANHSIGNHGDPRLNVAAVNPFWLDIITRSGGVPVMTNITPGPDRRYQRLNPNHLAAASAIAWGANVLVFLTSTDGVKDKDGTVMRWLDVEKIRAHIHNSNGFHELLPELLACDEALQNGVHRARILPFSRVQTLPSLFCERVDFGTEIILSSYAARR
jgi:acetylglutamate kinase